MVGRPNLKQVSQSLKLWSIYNPRREDEVTHFMDGSLKTFLFFAVKGYCFFFFFFFSLEFKLHST